MDRRGSAISPEYCYRDARAAIDFLERAFGFEPQLVVPGDGDTIAHAELRVGDDCIMLGSLASEGPFDVRTPRDLGGRSTGASYIARPDVETLYERARTAGATVVRALAATAYGSLDFSARDPEGFIWHFGTYRPGNSNGVADATPRLYAALRYERMRAAISFLCEAYGFSEQLVVEAENGEENIGHARLRFDAAVLLVGNVRVDEFAMVVPRTLDGAYTQTLNVFVADPDAHHERAKAAGAGIVSPPADSSYGSRGYITRDPEGYVWTFSTYRPAMGGG